MKVFIIFKYKRSIKNSPKNIKDHFTSISTSLYHFVTKSSNLLIFFLMGLIII